MKTKKQVENRLAEKQADPRISYKPAAVRINAPLALIQTSLEAQIATLQWVLDDTEELSF